MPKPKTTELYVVFRVPKLGEHHLQGLFSDFDEACESVLERGDPSYCVCRDPFPVDKLDQHKATINRWFWPIQNVTNSN